MKDDKQKIIELLKKEKELPTGKIAYLTGLHYYKVESLLKEMKELIKTEKGNRTYWRLK